MSAINYRRWVVPIAAPIALAAIFDSRRAEHSPAAIAARNVAMVLLAVIFSVVLTLQSFAFHRLLSGLRAEATALHAPLLKRAELSCIRGTCSITGASRRPSCFSKAARHLNTSLIVTSKPPRCFIPRQKSICMKARGIPRSQAPLAGSIIVRC